MEFIRMPELLSPELVKALAGNKYIVEEKTEPKKTEPEKIEPIDEMAATWREYFKEEKKEEKKGKHKPDKHDNECCCPEKVKFIFALNNTVVINVNAACEEEQVQPQ